MYVPVGYFVTCKIWVVGLGEGCESRDLLERSDGPRSLGPQSVGTQSSSVRSLSFLFSLDP